jgi:phage-related protein
MPLNLPEIYRQAKNEIASNNVWVWLLEIEITSEIIIRLTNNNENITYNGNSYATFPFTINDKSEDSESRLNNLEIQVGNANRVLDFYLKTYNGLTGSTVRLIKGVASIIASSNTIAFIEYYQIINSRSKSDFVSFTLGMPSLTQRNFPSKLYYKNFCNYTFKGIACLYTGITVTSQVSFVASLKSISSSNIKNSMGLEIGDKIIISGTASNNSIFTVDGFANNNVFYVDEVVVNETITGSVLFSYYTCDKTFPACVKRLNENRYGGFPSIPYGAIVKVKTNA